MRLGTIYNEDGNTPPDTPGWYYWEPRERRGIHQAEYVLVKHCKENNELRVWRAGYRITLPVTIMIGKYNLFQKLEA